jgi:hypothetical protein
MPRVTLTQSSFNSGELSPRVQGRTDLDRYQQGLKRCRNAHPTLHGGVKRRAGTRYTLPAINNTADASIIVPFVVGRDRAWQLEFSDLSVRVLNADGTPAGVTLATPYSAAQLGQIDWAQSDSTMYLFNPTQPIHRLQLLGASTWVLSQAPLTTQPFAETGYAPAVAATLSSAAVGSRTLTAAAPAFLAADAGRLLTSDAGVGQVTAYASTTDVTVNVTRAFTSTALASGQWTLDGSPQATCTPSAKDPIGATITLTLDIAGWRTADVGSMVRINGGLCRITGYTSALIVDATIVRVLDGTVAAPPLSWSLEPPAWSAALGYPRTGTVSQQRLVAGGTTRYPRTVWGSRIGEPLDFELGTDDDLAWSFTIDSDEASAIAYVTSTPDLIVLTESGEYSMRGGVEKPVTPTNVRVRQESNYGCAAVRPCLVGRETLFAQRGATKLRSLGYRYDFDGFAAPDISALADHIPKPGLRWLSFQQEPEQLLWAVRADGRLLSCTIDRDQQPAVIAWALHDLGGVVECASAIPRDNRDEVWLIVRRTINGSTVRYIERLDETFEPLHPSTTTEGPVYGTTVDCGIVVDNAAGQSSFTVAHLVGQVVDIVADGSKMPQQTVPVGGVITLPRTAKRAADGQAKQYELQAATERDNAQAEAEQIRREGSAARGDTLAALAGAGVTVGQGSALEAERKVVDDYTADEYMAILTGERRGRAMQETAKQTRKAGRDAMRAGFINAGTSLLSAGAQGMRATGFRSAGPGWSGTQSPAPVESRTPTPVFGGYGGRY